MPEEKSLRKCRSCLETKQLSEFPLRKSRGTHHHTCKPCKVQQTHKWFDKNPHKREEYYLTKLRKIHEKREKIKLLVCDICGERETALDRFKNPKVLAHDHDHATGMWRGYLCQRCNHLLGNARDSIDVLEAAIRYLNLWNVKKNL
jgi:hypothetical protein